MKTTKASPENYHHYNRDYKFLAREMRSNMTKAEKKLWQMLRKRSIHGFLFTRQRPVLEYVADFMCKELLLIIEADGDIHETEDQKKKDHRRDADLRDAGFSILRYKNWEILASPNEVFAEIKAWVEEKMKSDGIAPSSTPRPPSKGEA